MPAFQTISYDPIVLALVGSDERIAACLRPVFQGIKAGTWPLRRVQVRQQIYWTDACGVRLFVVVSPDLRHARLSGYQIVETIEP
jgi:hypothetical protein